jgi:hypothetical protein
MDLIPRRNIASLSFEIDLYDISNNIRCKHTKQRHISSNFELFPPSKILIIFNQISSYLYGIYSHHKYSNISIDIDLKYGMNVGRFEHQKRTIQLLKRSKYSQEISVLISQQNEVLFIRSSFPA